MRIKLLVLGTLMLLPMAGFAESEPGPLELTSPQGRKLYGLPDDQKLSDARAALAADPKNVDLMLALSKAQTARRQYKEAVATVTAGLALTPASGALLLERGHYELGLREFAAAKLDLQRAVELTPELLVFYHLGLAYYFLGDFNDAAAAFGKARDLSKDDDGLVSSSNWMYASLRRAGKDAEAEEVLSRISADVKIADVHDGLYLKLLHFFQGKVTESEVLPPPPQGEDLEAELTFDTIVYGVGNWNLTHHNPKHAKELFSKVLQGQAWNTFGFVASEVDLERMK